MPFNPAEPRDWRGRWTTGGADSDADGPFGAGLQDIAYNGHFHDYFVDSVKRHMAEGRVPCIKNAPITTLDGTTAIPDLICKSPVDGSMDFIEIKTGANPTFTWNQRVVFTMAQAPGHVLSFSNKLAPFGYPAGSALPRIDLIVARASGPGAVIKYDRPFDDAKGLQ